MICRFLAVLIGIICSIRLYGYEWEKSLEKGSILPAHLMENVKILRDFILEKKFRIAYPDIPSVNELHLPLEKPLMINDDLFFHKLSPGVSSLILEEARFLKLYDDFKTLADLRMKLLSFEEWEKMRDQAEVFAIEHCVKMMECREKDYRSFFLKNYIDQAYEFKSNLIAVEHEEAKPRWKLVHNDQALSDAFAYTEAHWQKLLRHHSHLIMGSLLASPYPFLMPAGRFEEPYYWDTYFGVEGLLATERLVLAQMQAENLLYDIRNYGMVPNGKREYYLTRSQTPFSSTLIRRVVEETLARISEEQKTERARVLTWVREKAFPLLEKEILDFWMNPNTRFDSATGLHHHWDDLDIPRPERHSHDVEEALGLNYRDVRALAETGLDFTDVFRGESGKNEVSQVATIFLNSMIFKFFKDLVWLAQLNNDLEKVSFFEQMANDKLAAIDKYLWNDRDGFYQNYHLRSKKKLPVLSADTFVPLFAGLASLQQAEQVRSTLSRLEFAGGVGASELFTSLHQWDGTNGWAPQQMMTIKGLLNYGYREDALRIAQKWAQALSRVYQEEGAFFERIDVKNCSKPANDIHKYPVQEGFLWTNASFVWVLIKVLNVEKINF